MTSKTIWGINDCSHDAALSVIRDSKILFAAHAERYNKVKNSFDIPIDLINEALEFGNPSRIGYFEKRHKKTFRRMLYGGLNGEYSSLYRKNFQQLAEIPETQISHHLSHAAAGHYTSGFLDSVIVVVDAIGEFETATIWQGDGKYIKKLFSIKYPVSFGLFYSAFTHLVGLEPGKEEYILMGMAGFGDHKRFSAKVESYFPSFLYQPINMHKGISNWGKIDGEQERYDIAAAAQHVYEKRILELMELASKLSSSRNLVFMGGCALNCKANSLLSKFWERIWIMPNPGDAGSSLGAAAAVYGNYLDWDGPYLGKNIGSKYPSLAIVEEILNNSIVAVASGRAEFGPRALGNRSILADPRKQKNKDLVNLVKKREKFRPFAPVVMEEHASEWFEMDSPSPYMQFAVKCLKPDAIPAVVHIDGTSRVQTVSKREHPGLYETLKVWKQKTGIPILLNTSLNIKNQPLLNDLKDVELWKKINPEVNILT